MNTSPLTDRQRSRVARIPFGLRLLGGLQVLLVGGSIGFSSLALATREAHTVVLHNLHTRRRLQVVAGLIPSPQGLNRFFRSHRDQCYTLMDPRLVALAVRAAEDFGRRDVEVVSGFRSRRVNDAMHTAGERVALHSRHVHGQAIDLRIPGVETTDLCRYFRRLALGGVGCYRKHRFIHVDVGPVRTWDE